ncbi:membrane bound O-acyl transferase family-domain-containing protein [Fennellomyces sp. T-0311]|nr:membrane bound O-acyl transferase family-domain-containing protein [Fennellomyces sp. T-0311]
MMNPAITFVLDRIALYSTCAVPSVLFYVLTRNDTVAQKQPGNDLLLCSVIALELALPILFDGKGGGSEIDFACNATLAIFLSFGMAHFILDRRLGPPGTPIEPFYNVLSRWNKRNSVRATNTRPKEYELATMRRNAFVWLGKGIFYFMISLVVMPAFDGFLRVCNDPLDKVPYMTLLLNEPQHIPARTLQYYAIAGIALISHVAVFPTFVLLWYGVELATRAILFPNSLKERHSAAHDFVHQPPLFDQPWLATSVHELWSRRWHQIFRWAFQGLVYDPVRAMFPTNKKLGRVLGTLAVFAVSGGMHDYILMAMFGYHDYASRPGIGGYQTLFFLLQGAATVISAQGFVSVPKWIGSLLTWSFILYSMPLFIEPYLRIGLHNEAEIPGYPRMWDSYLPPICPYGPKLGM